MIKTARHWRVGIELWHYHFWFFKHAEIFYVVVKATTPAQARAVADCRVELVKVMGAYTRHRHKVLTVWEVPSNYRES